MVRAYRRKKKCELFTGLFWDQVATKLVATFISVKVWGLMVTWISSSYFLLAGLISGGEWVTVNGTVTSVIYGCREFFKIAQVKQYAEEEEDKLK